MKLSIFQFFFLLVLFFAFFINTSFISKKIKASVIFFLRYLKKYNSIKTK